MIDEHEDIAEVVRDVFESNSVHNVEDQPANVVDVIQHVANAVVQAARILGNGDEHTGGAMELAARHTATALDGIAASLDGVAASLDGMADAIESHGGK